MIAAAKLPRELLPWNAGKKINAAEVQGDAFLFDVCMAGLHLAGGAGEGLGGYTIMDDSDAEIRKHLNAVRHARGRVLKTGLGFGVFVRMCLEKPEVEHLDVVEIDADIIEHFGAEFSGNPRVTIHHADAFEFDPAGRRWHLGWHDIYCEGNDGLADLHARLILKFAPFCDLQGAWNFPRWAKRYPGII
ncbi:MAG: hypothetical protein KDK11_14705 [Maritimibacter sp.]|nr:hypothetical protein [Maritimibacter sp.]